MRRWKKVAIILLGVIVLSQIPFAWRRYQLGRLNKAIQQLAPQRNVSPAPTSRDFKGVIHVHSFLGGHSTGTFDDIIKAAKQNGLDFVIMTEHPEQDFDTNAMTLNDLHGGILFISGNEVSTGSGDRLLLIPGDKSAAVTGTQSTQAVIREQRARGGLSIVAYPAEFKSWLEQDYDGVEVYNLFTNARRLNPLVGFFDGLWSYSTYPDLMFATFYERPSQGLQSWDNAAITGRRKLIGIAGNDAHANVGLSLNDAAGRQVVALHLDPYERSFRVVRTHVLLGPDQPLSRESLLGALASGHCYMSVDLFADPSGFNFTAENNSEMKGMGDEIGLGGGVKLTVTSPLPSRILLFRDGAKIQEESGTSRKEFGVTQAGIYRVEVYLSQLPKPAGDEPWIISNPIYVR